MSARTEIAWCDSTFNPWIGCTKVGPGCDQCYAEADFDLRKHRVKWGPGNPRSRTSPANWKQPMRWNRHHDRFFAEHGRRRRVFCASLADVFDNEVPAEWRRDLFDLILATPDLDWLLLTKRIGNAKKMLNEIAVCRGALLTANDEYRPPANVWLGATICNQAEADRDIPKLLATPAAVRWISAEPLLGALNIKPWLHAKMKRPGVMNGNACINSHPTNRLDWVVVGGESGAKARPSHPDWFRSLRDQCAAAGVPFLFKQWGEWITISVMPESECRALYRPKRIAKEHENQGAMGEFHGRICVVETDGIGFGGALGHDALWVVDGKSGMQMFKVGKKAAGRLLDGMQHDGYPEIKQPKETA